MECVSWLVPILPGKLEAWKAFDAQMRTRHAEFEASRRRMGIVREVASLAQTPQGDFLCLFHEGEDLARAFGMLATSDEPFDRWFRDQVAELHGLTPQLLLAELPAKLYFDYHPAGG